MKELIGKTVCFGDRAGTVVAIREEMDIGKPYGGFSRILPPFLRIIPEGEEHLEPIEVHPERCHERKISTFIHQ